MMEEFTYSNPLEENTGTFEPVTSKKEMAIRESTSKFATGNTDIMNTYMEAYNADPIVRLNNARTEAKEAALQGTAYAIDDMAETDPAALNAGADKIPQISQEAQQDYDRELGAELAYVDSLGIDFLDNEEREEAATQMWIRRQLGEIWDEDLWGTVTSMDGLQALLLPIHGAASADFMQAIDPNANSWFSTFLTSGDGLGKLGQRFNKLTPREKVRVYKVFKDAAIEATDNELEQMFLLMAATGQTTIGEERQAALGEKLDIGLTVAGMPKVISAIKRITSPVREVKKSAKIASTIVDVASRSDDAAAAVAMDRLDAATSAVPVQGMETILEGAAPEIAHDIQKHWETVDRIFQDSKDIIREGVPLTEQERVEFASKQAAKLEARPEVANLTFETTDKGVNFKYDVVNPMTGETKLKNVRPEIFEYTRDAVTGGFTTDKVPLMAKVFAKVVSPNTSLGKDRKFFVDTFTRVLGQRAKIRAGFQRAINEGFKGISKEGYEKLDIILKKGTLNDEVYSYRDLVKGDRPDLPQLTDKEFKAYAVARQVADQGWEMMNEDLRRQLKYRGNKTVQIGEQSAYAKVYDDATSAKQGYTARTENYVYDPHSGRVLTDMTPEQLDDFYNRGYKLTYLDTPNEFWSHEGESLKFALVKNDSIRELDANVLSRRKGYMPLIYKDAYHFVKEEVPTRIDGKTRKFNKTLRYFDNIKDAEDYAATLQKRNPEKTFKVLRDREMDAAEREADMINIYGGRYRSARAQERLLFGPEGAEAQFISPLEALGKYFGNLSTRYPISELKLALQDRWMNQAGKYLGHDVMTENFAAARGIVEQKVEDTLVRQKLLTAHDQITELQSIMSKEERDFSNLVKSIAENMDRNDHRKLAQGLYKIDQADPIQNIKGATFNLLLGAFNPSQFLVQGMGATVAMSISKEHAIPAYKRMLKLHYLDLAHDPKVLEHHLRIMEKEIPDIREYYQAWKRSGLFDAVVTAQGDYRIAASGVPITKSMMSKIMERGRLFFEQGELVSSRISFGIAYEEWKKANKGAKLTDAGLKQILARTENFKLNMSQSNRAWFQKGWQSIPFQFQQVATKSIEAMLGSHFSTKDKLNLLTGQLAIFGASGIPYGNAMVDAALNWAGVQPGDLNPDMIVAIKGGTLGWMLHAAGIDAEVATRFGNLNAAEESLTKLFSGDYSLGEIASGAAGGVYGRIFGFGTKQTGFLENMVFMGKVAITADDLTVNDVPMMMQFFAESLAEIPTSTRNLIGAYLMYNGQAMIKSNGQPLWQEDISAAQAITKALGFSPKSVGDYYEAQDAVKARNSLKREYVNLSVNLINKMAMAWDNDDEAGVRATGLVMNWIDSAFKDDPEGLYQLRKAVEKELLSGTDPKEVFIRKMIQKQLTNGDTFSSASDRYNVDVINALQGEQ
ncbi:hypothetical protein [Vibrio phage VP41s3]|nr:hypothetical protein [Vibrio phage VP41s3]